MTPTLIPVVLEGLETAAREAKKIFFSTVLTSPMT